MIFCKGTNKINEYNPSIVIFCPYHIMYCEYSSFFLLLYVKKKTTVEQYTQYTYNRRRFKDIFNDNDSHRYYGIKKNKYREKKNKCKIFFFFY